MIFRKLFGTDGIRGHFGTSPFTPSGLKAIAQGIVDFLIAQHHVDQGVVLGMDTRLSGPRIEKLFKHILKEAKIPTLAVGILPTPAVAHITRQHKAGLGIMISASHNPFEDNGLKFFDAQGEKLSDTNEKYLESFCLTYINALTSETLSDPWPEDPLSFSLSFSPQDENTYLELLQKTLPSDFSLTGMKLVVDCAHGAAFRVAPSLLRSLGAEVIALACDPIGTNINAKSGVLYPQRLQTKVMEEQADWGIAFDGDADRLLLVTHDGKSIDGEQTLALLAEHWKNTGRLPTSEVISTVMANGAFEAYLFQHGMKLHRTPVGDRFITHQLSKKNLPLGGEPSGHLILRDFSPCGDGLLAALHILHILSRKSEKGQKVFPLFTPYPHILHNMPLMNSDMLSHDATQVFLKNTEMRLQRQGIRLLVRPSGTEPLLRIFLEGNDQKLLQKELSQVVAFFQKNT